jgi:hypothetical protein
VVTRRAYTALTRALTLSLLCASCAQIFDIQDARVDSTLLAGSAGLANDAAGSANAGASPSAGAAGKDSNMAGSSDAGMGGSDAPSKGGGGSAGQGVLGMAGATHQATECENYCDLVTANCQGQYQQYLSFDQCIEVCKALPPGATGDQNVNTVGCRTRQAQFADAEPFVYCKSAGPAGEGKCGSDCLSYCSLMQETCTPSSTEGNLELSYFDSMQDCLTDCAAIPKNQGDPNAYSSSATASPSCFVGNNVYCRIYHVAAALAQAAPTEHCPHAMGGDPCIPQ